MESENDKTYYGTVTDVLCKRINEFKTAPDRYQSIAERLDETYASYEHTADKTNFQIHTGKYKTTWKGVNTMKDCREMIVYQAMFSEIKPLTVIELGTYTGGNAIWLADSLKSLDVPGKVITVDHDVAGVDPSVEKHQGVTFIAGDANEIEKVFPKTMLEDLPHPWLVIEDCHVNTEGTMRYFASHMEVGDYFAIEDTSKRMESAAWGIFTTELDKALGVGYWEGGDDDKHTVVVEFLKEYKDTFMVDSWFTDYFGYNGTNTWNGYIKKVK